MSDSVLARMALSFEAVWGPRRDISGLLLTVRAADGHCIDGAHLHALLREAWVERAPRLLVAPDHPSTLVSWLAAACSDAASPIGIVVPRAWTADPQVGKACAQALQRESPLLWRGALPQAGCAVDAQAADLQALVTLSLAQTVALLAAAQRCANGPSAGERARAPQVAGLLCEQIASTRLAAHCLDAAGAAGVVGWPMEDAALNTPAPGAPSRRVILSLLEDIEQDLSLEHLERRLSRDAVLAWRFLGFANSAGMGLREGPGSIRRALMMVGATPLRDWLREQLPRAAHDANIRPLREMSVLSAQLMQSMVDAGSEQDLLRELYLCGLFSDLDLLAGEALSTLLQHLSLPERVRDAVLLRRGAYAPYLRIVRAQCSRDAADLLPACADAELSLEDANRSLLRILSRLRPEQPLRLRTWRATA